MSYFVTVNTHARGCELKKGDVLTKYQAEKIGEDGLAELLKVGFLKEGSDQATPVVAEATPADEIAEDQIVEDEAPAEEGAASEEKPKKTKGKK